MASEDELTEVTVLLPWRTVARAERAAAMVCVPVESLYSLWIAMAAVRLELENGSEKRDRIEAG